MNIEHPLYIKRFKNVLDLGSGNSSFANAFQAKNLYMIDKSFDKIATNPLKLGNHTLCVNGDAEHLPFKNNSIELVLCRKVLHHLQHIESVKNEIVRIIKKNGYFFLIDIIVDVEDAYYNCASYFRTKDHIRYYRVNEILDFFKDNFRLLLYYCKREAVVFSQWLKNCSNDDKMLIESIFIKMPHKIKNDIALNITNNNCISFSRKEGYFVFQRTI